MSPSRIETATVARFSCLGDACPDTCCQGWGMQVTRETIDKLTREAPELLDAITHGEAEYVMKRDPATDICVKLDNGWCSIHRDYGPEFLGEACRFFPRVTRALGDTVLTSAALSCPETARLMLYHTDGFALTPRAEIAVPYVVRDYLPAGMAVETALAIHAQFMEIAGDADGSVERAMLRVSATARSIEMQPYSAWGEAVPFYRSMADGRIAAAEASALDPFNLLHAFRGLVMAGNAPRARLRRVIEAMAAMLGVTFGDDSRQFTVAPDAELRALTMLRVMRAQAETLMPVLRRYLQGQLSLGLFPFGGFGHNLSERVTIIGVRLATIKLALATLGEQPAQEDVVRVVQTISRFSDHLADPTLSLRIYTETGWMREARLRGLLNEH